MTYRHSPLTGIDDIRTLHVDSVSTDRPTKYSFQIVSLSDPPEYFAISYAWGEPEVAKRILWCSDGGGGTLALSRTLSGLLDSLLKRYKTFDVWIDAICINQEDPTEKARQVGMMGKVYSYASKVFVWLGEGTANTAMAFQFMENQDARINHDNLDQSLLGSHSGGSATAKNTIADPKAIPKSYLIPLWNLLERQWFRRVWIIQEVTLGTDVYVLCGDDMVPFSRFQTGILSLWDARGGGVDFMFDIHNSSYQALWCANRLFEIRDMFQASGSRGVKYERLLESSFHFLASDHRDFAFALHGIALQRDILFEPDYTIPAELVFLRTSAKILQEGKSLDLLACAGLGLRNQHVRIPSWVPDFRLNPFSEPLWTSDKAGWDAGGKLQRDPRIVRNEILQINVIKFDTVSIEGPRIFTTVFLHLRDILNDLLKLGDQTKTSPYDEPWLDVVCKTLVEGLDDKHKPVTKDFLQHFHGLRQLLDSISEKSSAKVSDEGEAVFQPEPYLNQPEPVAHKIGANPYFRTLGVHADGERTVVSSRGYLCMTNNQVRVGDIVYVVPGCRVPLILRPHSYALPQYLDHTVEMPYILIGWSYVHGIMHGEGLREGLASETMHLG